MLGSSFSVLTLAFVKPWSVLLVAALGLIAIFLLLPKAGGTRSAVGAAVGAVALLLAGGFWVRAGAAVETVLFYAFSGIAIVAGTLLITQRNPVRAALSFALVVMSTCGLFLLLAAPFLMAATLIVYAGAIVVTFLFVIMLAQQEGLSQADAHAHEAFLSSLAGFVLLGALAVVLQRAESTQALDDLGRLRSTGEIPALLNLTQQAENQPTVEQLAKALDDEGVLPEYQKLAEADRGSPESRYLREHVRVIEKGMAAWKAEQDLPSARAALADLRELARRIQAAHDSEGRPSMPAENVAALGRTLFTDYFFAVEVGGALLLVAALGAIAIAGQRREGLR
jgi:NADH:ubiquinone oxidoreductase subunit 6 (subunit J)